MNESTRPGEISRIAQSDYEFRVHMITHAADSSAWMKAHDKQDDERHILITTQINELKAKIGGVSSSVNENDKEISKVNTIRNTLFMFLGAMATAVGLLIAWWRK